MTLVPALSYTVVGQTLARRGRDPIILDDTFIDVDTAINLGILPTKPTKFNTGLIPGVPRITSSGALNITTPGTVIENRDHFGVIKINAANVTLRNVGIYGPDSASNSWDYLVDCRPTACVNARIERCLIKPKYPSYKYTGIIGHDFTAYRNTILWAVDGIGVYRTQQYNVPTNTVIESNYVDELAFFTGTYGVVHPSDDKSHNDAIQLQGGYGTVIRGNWLGGFLSTDPTVGTNDWMDRGYNPTFGSPWPQANAAVMVNSNAGSTQYTVATHNWIDGGSYNVNDPQSGNQGTWAFNRFGRYARYRFGSGGIQWPHTLVFKTGANYDAHDNVFDDDGTPILVKTYA